MDKTLLMAVDLGTSFIKTAVYDTGGAYVAGASEPVVDERPAPGMFIQRGGDLLSSVVACMKKTAEVLKSRAGDIEAIAFTGQMSGFMGVDSNWDDVTTWSCSLDNRYMPYAEQLNSELGGEFLRISGTSLPQMAPKYKWFSSEFSGESKRIAKLLMISGYVIGKLSDLPIDDAVIDSSFTTWTGLVDLSKVQWSEEICNAIGLDMKLLPKIVSSDTVCARLKKEIADATGLRSGIPLVSGAGDKAAGCVGSGTTDPGDMNFEASSYGAIHKVVSEYRPDMANGLYDCLPAAIPGSFYLTKFITGSGITLDWYINNFVRTGAEGLGDAFSRTDEEVAKIAPGSNGVFAVGLLGGSAMPANGTLRGMFMGFDFSHTKAHLYRALLESFAYDFDLTFKSIEKLYPEYGSFGEVKMIGGGAKSKVWAQINADVCSKVYQRLDRDDAATLGASILAGSGIGVFSDIRETAKSHIRVKDEFMPNKHRAEIYAPLKALYAEYLNEFTPLFERLNKALGRP